MTRLTYVAAFLGALLFIGPEPLLSSENQARKLRQLQPVPLTTGEAAPIGEDLFYDSETVRAWGNEGLKALIDRAMFVKNGLAIRSGVKAHFILAYSGPTPPGVVTPENRADWIAIQTGISQSKVVKQARQTTGGDVIVTWGQWIPVGRTSPVPPIASSQGYSILSGGFAAPETVNDNGPYVDAHESLGHILGAGHDDAHAATGGGAAPGARGFIAPDGRCDIMSTCSERVPVVSGANVVYQGVRFGDANHDNAGTMNKIAPFVANYVTTLPQSQDRSCTQDVETGCLLERFRVKVQWADPNSPMTGFSSLRIGTRSLASFWVGGSVVRITLSSGTKVGIVGPKTTMPYRVIVTDAATGHVRAWQAAAGQALNVTIPKF